MIPLRDDNPIRTVPWMTYALIALCVLVFLWQVSLGPERGESAIFALGLIPDALLGHARLSAEAQAIPAWMTVLTSMFLHGGWAHLIGNMLYVWIFADNVEDRIGHGRFLLFYLLCGIAAALSQAVPAPHSQIPMVGASGAISGVLAAYLRLFPRAQVVVLIPLGFFAHLTRLPAVMVLGLWFLLQLLSERLAPEGTGIAFRAHIGGFVAGWLLLPVFRRRRGR